MRLIFVPAVTSETELAQLANGISEETLKYCPLKPRGFLALQLVTWHFEITIDLTKLKLTKKHRSFNKNKNITMLKSP